MSTPASGGTALGSVVAYDTRPNSKLMDELEQQVKLSRMLAMGFVFSIAPLPIVGSLMALILGWKGRRMIQASERRLSGRIIAWWCILGGALGTLLVLIAGIILVHEAIFKP